MTPPQDKEMAAIQAIARALEPLDRQACERVVQWAEKRYVRLPLLDGIDIKDSTWLTGFMQELATLARRMNTEPKALIAAVERAWELAHPPSEEPSGE